MSLLENKTMTILVVVNVIFLMVIVWLIGFNMGESKIVSVQPPVVPVVESTNVAIVAPVRQEPVEAIVKLQRKSEQKVTLSEAIVNEVNNNEPVSMESTDTVETVIEEPVMINKTTTIDVYYDGSLAQIVQTDEEGNKVISISNNLKEVEKLSESDEAYLAEYRKMKAGQIGHMSMYKVTQEQAKTSKVQPKITEEAVDYFNKVEISEQRSAPTKNSAPLSLAQKISMLVSDDKSEKTEIQDNDTNQEKFIASLQSSSEERSNETRTITVKLGDSLWKIAVRAYGSGYEFPRIYKANPHIKNPNLIRVGEKLRVPL